MLCLVLLTAIAAFRHTDYSETPELISAQMSKVPLVPTVGSTRMNQIKTIHIDSPSRYKAVVLYSIVPSGLSMTSLIRLKSQEKASVLH